MNMIPYTNTTGRIQTVGGKMIHPGETRDVPSGSVPAPARPVAFDDLDDLPDALVDISVLATLIKGAVPRIVEALPGMDDAHLAALEEMESEQSAPRKGVLEAIEAEKLKRAAASLTEGGDA